MMRECKKRVFKKKTRGKSSLGNRKEGVLPVEMGLQKEKAVGEAQRCLGLTDCDSCEICGLFCPDLCITRDEKTGETVIDFDYCKGCGICASVCPKGAISMIPEL